MNRLSEVFVDGVKEGVEGTVELIGLLIPYFTIILVLVGVFALVRGCVA